MATQQQKKLMPKAFNTPKLSFNNLYMVIYGQNGKGKTPLVSYLRNPDTSNTNNTNNESIRPLIIDAENGAAGVTGCYVIPQQDGHSTKIADFNDLVEWVDVIESDKESLELYSPIVLDGFNSVIEMADLQVCKTNKVNTLYEVANDNIVGYTQRNNLVLSLVARLEALGKGLVIVTQEDYKEAGKSKPASCKPKLGSDSLETRILNKANFIVRVHQAEEEVISEDNAGSGSKKGASNTMETVTYVRLVGNATIVARARWTGKEWLAKYMTNGCIKIKNYETSFNFILKSWLEEAAKVKQAQVQSKT